MDLWSGAATCRLIGADRKFAANRQTDAFDPSATWAGSADQLAVPADESTVAFMRLKRAVDAVDETLPDSGRVEQMLPNVAERKRRLKEQVRIRGRPNCFRMSESASFPRPD